MAETKLQPYYASCAVRRFARQSASWLANGHNIAYLQGNPRSDSEEGRIETSKEHDARVRSKVIDRYSSKELYAFRIERYARL